MNAWARRAWITWIGFWDRRELPHTLALVRVLVAGVVLWDLFAIWQLDLVVPLFGPAEAGAIGDPLGRDRVPELYAWFPPTAATAWAAWGAVTAGAALLLLGLGTRLSALVLLLGWAQLALVLPPSDRGIDMLLRNAVLLLAVSRCGAAWSLDARLRTGRWGGDGTTIPSWPRYLFVIQLVLLYFTAGMHKVAISWLPMGDWSALFVAMRDPAFARFEPETINSLYRLTQVGTAMSWTWGWMAPLLLLALWFRDTRTRGGRLRACFNSVGFVKLYLLVGFVFHVGTHFTMRLGIFPFAVLALYPALLHPDELGVWARRWRARCG